MFRKYCINKTFFLLIIFTIITTISQYKGYGVIDQVEQLPLILRSFDKSFLLNDFFVNAGSRSIARLYFSNFVVFLARSESNLPILFLILTFLSNLAISIVTFFFARNLFESDLAGIISSALVLTLPTFELGYSSIIYQTYLVASTIAIPIIFFSIYLVANGKLVFGILLCGIASLFHALFGLEIGTILLASQIISTIISNTQNIKNKRNSVAVAFILLVVFSLVSLIPEFKQHKIDSNLFIYILAIFRHPHHYLPSTFKSIDYFNGGAFLFSLFLFLYIQRDKSSEKPNIIEIMVIFIILLCVGGFVFVEIIPTRIWTMIQAFRLLFIIKWLVLAYAGGLAAECFTNDDEPAGVLLLISILNPLTLAIASLLHFLKYIFREKVSRLINILVVLFVLILNIVLLFNYSIPISILILYGTFMITIYIINIPLKRILIAYSLLWTIFVSSVIYCCVKFPITESVAFAISDIEESLSMGIKPELNKYSEEVAFFCENYTPSESVFLTPPDWGQFRLLANRAIVVDFKAFPFTDDAILEWYDRLTNCYGNPEKLGFSMVDELQLNYKNVTDGMLLSLQKQYYFSYAILYSSTDTSFEVIYENEKYKVVSIN